jgi:iron complex transport system substrate-binding protein
MQPKCSVTFAALNIAYACWLWFACHAFAHANSQRDVIVVGGSLTEIVYALGAQGRLIATDTTSSYPEAAAALTKVGYQRNLSSEGLLSLNPKLILATAEAGPPSVIAQVRAAGVRVEVLPTDYSLQSVLNRVDRVAQLLNVPTTGATLKDSINQRWKAAEIAVARYQARASRPPKVLYVLAHGGPQTQVAGEATSADSVIRLAGAQNAMSGFKGYRPLSAEGAIAAAPDLILITREGLEAQGGIDALLGKSSLALTPAGKARRVVAVDALMLMGFGPRMPDAVQKVADAAWSP